MNRRYFIGAASAGATALTQRAAWAQSKQSQSMAALIAAARAEGSVVVDGPGGTARTVITEGFQREYGIPVTYVADLGGTSGARVRAERAAGKYLLDVLIGGSDTPSVIFLPNGWLDPIEPALIAPDVIDKRKWRDNHLWYVDDGHTILRFLSYVFPELAINTKFVKPGDVPTWKSLLDPKWQGKMVAKDPTTSGSGGSLTSYFYLNFGPDFIKQLYRDQRPQFSRDARQAMQWLADGTYPILVGPDMVSLMQFQKLGYPIVPVFPKDGPDVISGGYGLLGLVNKAPHPNAAKLFCNWFAGPAAQLAFAKATQAMSLRADLNYGDDLPSFERVHAGGHYLDTYDYKFVTQQRQPAEEKVRELLGF